MSPALRRRVAVILVWVLALTGSAAAFSACRHGDAAPVAVNTSGLHADGHGAHGFASGEADPTPGVGAGCGCGCTCAANCNHVCSTASLPPPVATAIRLSDTALLPATRDAAVNPATHPPIRPPTASL